MKRTAFVIVAVLACLSVNVFAADAAVDRRKAEKTAKADTLFGQRYIAATGKRLRLYDEQTESGPPDGVIYWHGSIYVIELIFAADGKIARLAMLPEALLHGDDWSDVSKTDEVSRAEMRWLMASANALQPLGAGKIREAPDGCFQSGPNLYCADSYELASVSHYHIVRVHEKNVTKPELRDISILYRQTVNGVVEDARVDGSQRQIKVDGQWYHGEKPGIEIFERAQKGSVVRFTTYGCAANEKVCLAGAEQSKSTTTRQ